MLSNPTYLIKTYISLKPRNFFEAVEFMIRRKGRIQPSWRYMRKNGVCICKHNAKKHRHRVKSSFFLGGTPRFERGNVAFVLLNDIAQLCIGGCRNFWTIGSFVVKQCIHWLNVISSFSCIKQRLVLGSVGGRWLACVNDTRPMPSHHGHNNPHSWVPDIPFPCMLCLCHSRSLLFLFDAHG